MSVPQVGTAPSPGALLRSLCQHCGEPQIDCGASVVHIVLQWLPIILRFCGLKQDQAQALAMIAEAIWNSGYIHRSWRLRG